MATEEQTQQANGAGAERRRRRHPLDHRQPDRQDLRGRDHRRDDQGDGPAPDQGQRGRLRDDDLRPRVHQHGVVPLVDHLHRRRGGDPPAPRLHDRGPLREVELPRGRLPARLRRAADRRAARPLGLRRHPPHLRPRGHEGASSRASATTPTRWGSCSPASARCRPSTRTRRRSTTRRSATWRRSG